MQSINNVPTTERNGNRNAVRPPFPEHLRNLRELMPELLSILEKGKESEWYAFVWLEEVRSLQALSAKVESVQESMDRGIVFRILSRGINYERSTNRLDSNHLREFASAFRAEVERRSEDRGLAVQPYRPRSLAEERSLPLPPELLERFPEKAGAGDSIHFSPDCEADPASTTVELLKTRARELREKIFSASERVGAEEGLLSSEGGEGSSSAGAAPVGLADVRVMLRQSVKTQIFVDRTRNISQVLPVTLAYLTGVSRQGHTGRAIRGGLGGLEAARVGEEEILEAAIIPLRLDRAAKLKPGRYRVITGPDVTGVIAHEAFGHTQEGDTCMKGRSIAPGLRASGTKVGNDQATIINFAGVFSMDNQNTGPNGSYFFDHEGQFSRPQAILEKGMLSEPMTDLLSSLQLKVPRSANGKRESWRRPLMTRQTNTYFTPGDKSLEDMIAMVEEGFLARHAHGGMEDPKGGSLTAGTEYLEEIKNGKLTGRIFLGPNGGHVELSDPVFTLLDRIQAKSGTEHPRGIPLNKYGGCGKYHKESVEAGSGGPWILWESITCG